jgi:hypothetical protein
MANLHTSRILGLSAFISALVLVGSVIVPPLLSWSEKYTEKGFFFEFYNPGNYDYGSSFYPVAFLADFFISTLILTLLFLLIRKLLRRRLR